MSDLGYYVHLADASAWIIRAQKSILVKNKVRKELWQELVDVIHWDPLPISVRRDYLRIPQASFVAMQTFCLTDGKGVDTVSSDQLLNFCTTLDSLRSRMPVARLIRYTEPHAHELVPVATVHNPMSSLVREHEAAADEPVAEEESPRARVVSGVVVRESEAKEESDE